MQLSAKGNTVTLPIDIWYDPPSGEIHVATRDQEAPTFHVAVTDDPTKPNGHPSLFQRLKKALQDKGAPAPP